MNIIHRTWSRITGRGPAAPAAPANAHQRGWKAARMDRFTADWLATTNSITQELRNDLDRLRTRGRDLGHNNDYAAKFIEMVQTNIVGSGGVRLQSRVVDAPNQPDRRASAAIEAAWAKFGQACTLDKRQTLRDLCATLVGGLPTDGEFLVQIVRGKQAGNPFGIALQPIDVDRIDTTCNQVLPNGGAIITGVEVDAYRTPVAVHIYSGHPNDGHSSRQRTRLPLADCIHGFRVTRAGQLRGFPWMAPGMLSLHHLGNFKLAALLAAEHGANHYGFFTTPDGQAPIGAVDNATGEAIQTSQPGTYDTLPAGVSFQAHESKYPEQNFGPFVKTTLQRIATGWGVAYHSLANDLEGVSFSSIRSGTLEERDRWMADQEWFIATFMEPVFQAWLDMALASGAIPLPGGTALSLGKRDKFARHEWQPRRWEWVDPKSDMEAKVLSVRAGLMSPQDLSAAMGYDFEDTLASIKQAQDLAKTYGVALTAYEATPGAVQAGANQPTPAKPSP